MLKSSSTNSWPINSALLSGSVLMPLFAQRFLLLEKRSALLLRLAQLGTHGVELFLQDRADRVLDDVLNDVVGRVVGAGGFALVLVVFEIDLSFFLDPVLAFERGRGSFSSSLVKSA